MRCGHDSHLKDIKEAGIQLPASLLGSSCVAWKDEIAYNHFVVCKSNGQLRMALVK